MAVKVANYISNLGKSVAYAAVDRFGKMSPTTSDLVQTNSELFKEVTSNIINYKSTYKRGLNYFKTSKIYEAADTGITSVFEDLQSGKLWNKERIDKITTKNLGFGDDDGFDMNFGDSDEDFGSFNKADDSDITGGDEMITDMIAASGEQNAQMISSTIARTSKYLADTQKTSTNILYTQNMHAYNLFNNNLSAINANISKVMQFQTTTLQTHAENSKKYFEESTKMLQQQTALLQQIAERVVPKQQEQRQSGKITYDDVMGRGVPDMKMYMKNVKRNFGNALGSLTSMNGMMGSDSNMLEMFMASPLQFIPTYIVNQMIPKSLDKAVNNFDKSLKGFFGSIIAKINGMKNSDNMLMGKIGEIFGISNTAKSSLETKNYNKGKVDWDGKSRKALIEVIPGYLSKILSALSGKAERVFDYDEGKFTDSTSVKKNFDNDKKSYVKDASGDVLSKIDEYMKYITFNTVSEQKKLREDIDKILTGIYDKGGYFDLNSKNDLDYTDYGVDSKSMSIFKTMFRNMEKSIQLGLGASVIEQREKQTKNMKFKEENADSVYQTLFNGFNPGEFLDKKGKFVGPMGHDNLLKTLDNKGHNIFYYLQNIWKELVMIKRGGGTGGSSNTAAQILYGNTSAAVNQNDFEVPDGRKEKPGTSERQTAEREQKRFEEQRDRIVSKDKNVVNVSNFTDDKALTRKLGSKIETEKIKTNMKGNADRKKTLIDKLLEADSLTSKTKTVVESLDAITQKPMKFIINTINKVDQRMYDLVFGKSKYKGQDVEGIFGIIKLELTTQFGKLNHFIDEKILNPIKEKLDIENMRDLGKKIFGMFGLDIDQIKKGMHDYLFDKDGGLLSAIKEGVTGVFKNAWQMSKDSLKTVYGPAFGKIKDKFRGKTTTNMVNSLQDLDTYADGDTPVDTSNIVNVINNVIHNAKQKDYDSIFANPLHHIDKKKKKQTLEAMIKTLGITDANKEKQHIDTESQELTHLLDMLTRPGVNLGDSYQNEYNTRSASLKERQKNYKKYTSYNSMLQSMGNIEQQQQYQQTVGDTKERYSKGLNKLVDFDDTEKALLEKLFDKLVYGQDLDRLKFNKLIQLAGDLSKKDNKYKSLYSKLMDYSTIFSDTGRLSVDDVIQNDRRKVNPTQKTAADFINSAFATQDVDARYNESSAKTIQIIDVLKDTATDIKDKITGIFDMLKDAFSNKNKPSSSIITRPTGLDSWIRTSPEGGATLNFAQDLTNVIANWMANNMPHHEQGGVIDNPQVASLNKGEVVLTPENVKALLAVLDEIETGAKAGKTAKDIGMKSHKKVDSLVKGANIGNDEDFSKFMSYSVANPEMFQKLQLLQANKMYDKVFNIFNINLQKAMEDYTTRIQQFDKSGIPTDPVQRALYNESEPFAKQVVNELYNGTTKVHDALFGTNEKRDKKKFGEAVSDVTRNISKYAPEAIGAGLLGGGVSLITGAIGGPLLGAAVGAGISLTKNSEKVQNWLFGDMDLETHERQGGVIPKKYIDKISKLAPDLQSYGIAGGLTGLLPFVPFGPLGGLMIGSGIAFAKNNTKVMDFLFGEKGLINPQRKEKIAKFLPKMAAGAGIGLLTGPFGLVGNAAIGAAGGMLASTDTFNKFFFGTKDPKTGEYENGLLPSVRHVIVDPLKKFMHVTNTRIQDFISDKILAPLKEAFAPIKKDVQMLLKGMFDKTGDFINKMFENAFGIPLTKFVEDKLLKPMKGFVGGMFKALTFLPKKLISAPFSMIGAVGRSRRKAHIRKGNADYMTAEERVNFRKTNNVKGIFGRKDRFAEFDEMMVNMTDEDKQELLNTLGVIGSSEKDLNKQKRDLTESMGSEISKYLGYDDSKIAMKELNRTGDANLAKKLIDKQNSKNLKVHGKREDLVKGLSGAWNDKSLSPSERARLLKDKQKDIFKLFDYETGKKVEKLIKDGKFNEVNKLVGELRNKDNTKAFDLINLIDQNSNKLNMTNKMLNDSRGTTLELQDTLKDMPLFDGLDLTNKKDIQKYMNLIQKEVGAKNSKDPNVTPEQTVVLEIEQKNHKEIIDLFKDAVDLLKDIANRDIDIDNTEKAKKKSARQAYKASYGKSKTQTPEKNKQDRVNALRTDLISKRFEEIQNSHLPEDVKNQALKDLMKFKKGKATTETIKGIKTLPNPDEYLNKFRADLRENYGMDEEELKNDPKHKPYFDMINRKKDEKDAAAGQGVDSKDVSNFAAGGMVEKTGVATLSRGEYVNTPNAVQSIMETVPNLLKTVSKSESDNKGIFEQMLDRLTSLVRINKDKDNVVEKIDDEGNVMKFFRNSRNDLVADRGDTGTRKALEDAENKKTENQGMFAKFGGMFKDFLAKVNPFGKDKEKKGTFLDGIMDKVKTVAGIAAGVTFLPQIIKFAAPIVKDLWDNNIQPFLKNTVGPWLTNTAIPFLAKTLGDSISYTLTTILPAALKGIGGLFGLSGQNGEESLGGHMTKVVARDALTGGRGVAAVGRAIENSAPRTLKGKAGRVVGKTGFGILGKVEKIAASPLKLIDKVAGLNTLGTKAGNKVGDVILNKGINVVEGVKNIAEGGEAKGLIGKLGKKIIEFFDKLMANGVVKKLIGNKRIIGSELAKPLVKFLEENALKLAAKVSAKTAAAVSSAGIINAAWAIGDFVSGWNSAENIIGITGKATIGMKLAAGTIKAVDGLLLFGLIPEHLLVDLLLPVFSKIVDSDGNIEKQREAAKDEVAKYNSEHGTNYSIEQYNKTVLGKKGLFGKMGDGLKSAGSWISNNAKWAGGKIAEGAKDAGSWIKTNVSNAADSVNKKIGSIFGLVDDEGNAMSATQGISKGWTNFTEGVKKKWDDMRKTASDALSGIGDAIGEKFKFLKENISKGLQTVDNNVGTMLGLQDESGNTLSLTESIKQNGLGKTISAGASSLKTKAANAIGNGWNKVRSFFGGNGEGDRAPKANTRILKDGGFGGSEANGMVYFSQGDSDWKDTQYGTGTIGSSGCGPTSAAMVISSLTKKNVTPVDTSAYSVAHGYRVPGVGTSWGFFNDIGKQYGINFNQTTDTSAIMDALRNRQPVIFSGKGAAPFTNGGHFIVGAGTDGSGIKINDPVSMARSKTYPSSQIFGDMATAFIADKATDGSIPDLSGSSSSTGGNSSSAGAPSIFNMLSDLQTTMSNSFSRIYGLDPTSGGSDSSGVGPTGPSTGLASDNIVNYIKTKEGFRPNAYRDSGGVLTIGYGTTSGPLLSKGTVTEAEAVEELRKEVNEKASAVKRDLDAKGVKLSQNQFDALVSFAYNLGTGGLLKSTLYKDIVSGARGAQVTQDFEQYIHDSKGNRLAGLVKRRDEEANIFNSGSAPGYTGGGNGGFGPQNKELLRYRTTKENALGGFGKAPSKIENSKAGGFGKAPSKIENSKAGGFGTMLPYQEDQPIVSKASSSNSVTTELIKSIINVLVKISSNTDNLQKIVELLANVLDVKVPKEQLQKASTAAGKQNLTDMLTNSVGSNNNIDNSSLIRILNSLATE